MTGELTARIVSEDGFGRSLVKVCSFGFHVGSLNVLSADASSLVNHINAFTSEREARLVAAAEEAFRYLDLIEANLTLPLRSLGGALAAYDERKGDGKKV